MTDAPVPTRAELLENMQRGLDECERFLSGFTPEQLTGPTDAAGWTVKDHITHMAAWADSITAALGGKSRREAMGLDESTWASRDFDQMNAVIQRRLHDVSLDEALRMWRESHARLAAAVERASDEELRRPMRNFDPSSSSEYPMAAHVAGNSYEHYEEHRPWIEAIVRGAS